MRGRILIAVTASWALTVLPALLVLAPAPAAADQEPEDGVITGSPYPGDPETEAEFVAAEDERLLEVRTVGSVSQWSETPLKTPYRLATGTAYTLVLTARREPYTVQDLLVLAPQTFVRQPDGAYLLSENLVLEMGAILDLGGSGGLRLLMASDADGFVSIVNDGGRLDIQGTTGAPVEITSFDRNSEGADLRTEDGRAYLRSIGGQVSIAHAEISHLGFWSGRTGGVSLTGTDRPNSGALDTLGESLAISEMPLKKLKSPRSEENQPRALSEVLPSGPLPVPTVDIDSPRYSFVSAAITDTTVTGNAFGLFVSGANGLDIRQSTFADSLVSGIVLHRYVVNAVIEATAALRNGVDGLVLARATTGIVLSEVRAVENGRNGVTMSGLPLANGPSATGTSVGSYGNNTLSNSEASRNGRYGVEVIGGRNVGVLANDVAANSMGVVVREGAAQVDVVGNHVDASVTHGIAVRDGVGAAQVSGNMVDGGETSLYVRDSVADLENNTLRGATSHAVSLVGDVGATAVMFNKVSGRGPSALDTERAPDVERNLWVNDLDGWEDTTPFLVTLGRFLQPLTLMWLLLASLLVFTAVRGARARRQRAHPYADKAPVSGGLADATVGRDPEGVGR